MILYPNAKINIGLNVIKKRIDGFHEISSVFYPVKSLYDILEIIPSNILKFSSTGLNIPGKENICLKAVYLLQEDFNIGNVKIHLHKKIPIGAGMGGGSADGAYTLIALNNLFNLNLSNIQLKRYALKLGADCPFFIDNKPKYITGIGEKMQGINLDLSSYKLKFIFPKKHISTKEAYNDIIPVNPKIHLLDLVNQSLDNWKGKVINDFEFLIFQKYPVLKKIKQQLYEDGAIYASMSGSGSMIYGIFLK